MIAPARELRLTLTPEWEPGAPPRGPGGLLAPDPRVRTLLRVLLSYPEVRFVLPDRVSLDQRADPRLLETMTRFLSRQAWLVRGVSAL